MEEEILKLRTLLWMHHGCPITALYGDDGEMQCHECMLDFKRDSIEKITSHFTKRMIQLAQEAFKKEQDDCPHGEGKEG